MQKHYNYLNIDLDKKIHTKLKAKQGDSKSRYILVNLISNSTYYDLTGTTVKIYGIKKDKTIFFNHATIIDAKKGQFEIELTNQALAVIGEIEIQILILGTNDEKLTTFSFFINVEKTIVDDAAIESTNEFTALTTALSSVQNIDNRFREVDEQFNTKANKDDVAKISSGTPLFASSTTEMTDTTRNYVNTTDGYVYIYSNGSWTKTNMLYQSTGIGLNTIRYEHTDFFRYYENTLNPIPKSTGTFWWYVDGVLTEKASANFNCHNRILLRKGVTYYIGDVYGLASIVTKLDGNTKIASLSSVDGVFTGTYTPTQDCYLYPTLYKITDSSKTVVLNSNSKFPLGSNVYLSYGKKYDVKIEDINLTDMKNDVDKIKNDFYKVGNIINIKKDGTGDFSNIVSAIKSITDSSMNNRYAIYLHDDEDNIYQFMDSTMLDNKGMWLPDGVDIIGVGGKRKIHCELPDTETDFRLQNVSTLNLKYNNNLENLIVTGKNVRYAVHDESSNTIKDWKRNVKNCDIEHLGNPANKWSSMTAWGEGCSSGSESIFENCTFVTNSITGAYGCHNNTSFTKPSKHKFINCRFINSNTSGYSVKFGSMGSAQTDEVEFINCRFTGKLYSGEELSNGCGLDFKIYGSGNDNVFCDFSSTLSKNKIVDFIGETITCLNNSGNTITKGTLVKTTSYLSVTPMTASDNVGLFYGVAIEDIPNGGFGLIKQKGYIEKGNLVANDGDYLGISNATFSVITNGIPVAKVVRGFIKLI